MKKQLKFKVTRKGYDIAEVDNFLNLEADKNEKIHAQQRERIVELVNEISDLKRQLKEYREREGQISSAIISATEKAEKMTADLKFRYAMEMDRLSLFRAKWTGVYQEMKERYGFQEDALNVESVAVSTRLEIERFLSRDFSLAKGDDVSESEETFKSEVERLSQRDSAVCDLKEKLLEALSKKDVACNK